MNKGSIPLFRVRSSPRLGEQVQAVLDSGRVSDGPAVSDFEQALKLWLSHDAILTVSDISAAVTLALHLAGVRPGDEVIAPPMLCLATSIPILNLGARVAWADVNPLTGMLDPDAIAPLVSARTKAILYYHWSGDAAAGESIDAVARQFGIPTIEDASDAFGLRVGERLVGSGTADFTCFSFRSTKHINAVEGAAITLRSPLLLERATRLRRYGINPRTFRSANGDINPRSDVEEAGWNFALSNVNATIALENWVDRESVLSAHRENGHFYDDAFKNLSSVVLPGPRASAFWTYSFLSERRDELVSRLVRRGVTSQRLHVRNDTYSCFRDAVVGRKLTGTDFFDGRTISIPCGWWLDDDDRHRVARTLVECSDA